MKKIFLSHKTQDKPLAQEIKKALEALDFEVWFDVTALYPGDQWPKAIANGVNDTDVTVVLWTREAQAKPRWVEFEYNTALALEKPVITVSFPGVDLPLELRAFQGISFSDPAQTAKDIQRRKRKTVEVGSVNSQMLTEEIGKIREVDSGEALRKLGNVLPVKENDFIKMVSVKGGTFKMGSIDYRDEQPIHDVTLDDFSIGTYPVTQKQWIEVMGEKKSNNFIVSDNCPIESVSWNDTQEFIEKLNSKTGFKFRLPTEAEWEFAAKGGLKSKGYRFAGSNWLKDVAWFAEKREGKIQPVGKLKGNELGLHDMSGNIWEWCNDWYGSDYYSESPIGNPKGISSGTSRVVRGGSWVDVDRFCRVSVRFFHDPDYRSRNLGFRLARSVP